MISAKEQDPGTAYEHRVLRVQKEVNARGEFYTPPQEPVDIRALNEQVRKNHARQKRAMDMWDEMTAFMEGGPEPDFLGNSDIFRERLEGNVKQPETEQ